jgi:hypothetical protein
MQRGDYTLINSRTPRNRRLGPRHSGSAAVPRPLSCLTSGRAQGVQILLGHRKVESTVRYLGVDLEDALTLSEGTDV